MAHDVSVIGALNIDLIIKGENPPNWEALSAWDGGAQIDMTPAGSVGYTAQNLARLGLSVCVSSCLPDDPFGQYLEDTLRGFGVDTELVQRIPGTFGGVGVYLLMFGSRKRPLFYRVPSHPLWRTEHSAEEVNHLLDARALHCGGYLHYEAAWHGATRDLFREAKARGLITSLDSQCPLFDMPVPWMTALTDVLPYLDFLFCDGDEACKLTAVTDFGVAAQCLLDAGAATVIIKHGADGSTVYRKGWQYQQAAESFGEVEDTVGAGDAYAAAFLYGVLQGWSLEEFAFCASVAAGFSVTGVGGVEAVLDLPLVLAEMEKRR